MTQRLSPDWQAQYGHPLLVAESFVDPARFAGTCYRAANWQFLGHTRGYARHNGQYTEPHGRPKQLYVYPLRRDARERLCDPGPLPAAWEPKGPTAQAPTRLRSLYEELAAVQDFRRAQGRKHSVASVLAVYILARLANLRGPVAAAEYAQQLSQSELKAIGAWKSPRTGRYVPVSKSTLHRVIGSVDPEQIEALRRFAMPRWHSDRRSRSMASAFAAPTATPPPGTTATLVAHDTRLPVATLGFRAARPQPCAPCCAGRGASAHHRWLYTTRETARLIVTTHAADYLMTVKKNAPETHQLLSTLDWERDATGHFREPVGKAHGRIEQRAIAVLTPPQRLINYPPRRPGLPHHPPADRRAAGSRRRHHHRARLRPPRRPPRGRRRSNCSPGTAATGRSKSTITSAAEDACLARTRFAPINNATCTNIALAVILHRTRFDSIAAATRHFAFRHQAALDALLQP